LTGYYKGISFPFRIDGRGSIASSKLTPNNLSRISESIEQILFTYPGERIMEPEFGSKVKDYIFENLDNLGIRGKLQLEIQKAIEKWEPRVEIQDINIYFNKTTEQWFVDIMVLVIQFQVETVITLNLTGKEV